MDFNEYMKEIEENKGDLSNALPFVKEFLLEEREKRLKRNAASNENKDKKESDKNNIGESC